jgi:hypothetical protein
VNTGRRAWNKKKLADCVLIIFQRNYETRNPDSLTVKFPQMPWHCTRFQVELSEGCPIGFDWFDVRIRLIRSIIIHNGVNSGKTESKTNAAQHHDPKPKWHDSLLK